MQELVSLWDIRIQNCKSMQIISQKVEEDGIFDALEKLGMVEKKNISAIRFGKCYRASCAYQD